MDLLVLCSRVRLCRETASSNRAWEEGLAKCTAEGGQEHKQAIPCSDVATTTPALGTMVSMLSKSCTLSLKDLFHSEIAVELQGEGTVSPCAACSVHQLH